MVKLPKAQVMEDGSVLMPPAARELLHRLLADISIGVEVGDTVLGPGEAQALAELQELLPPAGRMRPLWKIMGTEPPKGRPTLHRVK